MQLLSAEAAVVEVLHLATVETAAAVVLVALYKDGHFLQTP
jgi:hypothetical protein